MSLLLEKELEYFKKNQDNLVKKYNGKILVLHNQEVVGIFDNNLQAYQDAKKHFKPGTFMIQKCIPGSEAYTVHISTLGIIDAGN
ncbi:MAG: hypothetical protein LBJ48_05795 [Coriobacteriales bacterium]|nr:hypothetical protein [Coriobacteriales bacterium]